MTRDSAAALLLAQLPSVVLADLYLQALAMTCAAGCDGDPTGEEIAQDVRAMLRALGYPAPIVARMVAPFLDGGQ